MLIISISPLMNCLGTSIKIADGMLNLKTQDAICYLVFLVP